MEKPSKSEYIIWKNLVTQYGYMEKHSKYDLTRFYQKTNTNNLGLTRFYLIIHT